MKQEELENQKEQLQKINAVFNTDRIVSTKEMKGAIEAMGKLLNEYKKGTQEVNSETKQILQDRLDYISSEHERLLNEVKNTSEMTKSEATEAMAKAVEEVKKIAQEVMEMKPLDGLDADEELIIEQVLSKIKLPEYKETVLDDGAQIIGKINEEKVAKIKASQISDLPKFTREVIREVGGHAGAMETPLKDATTRALLPKDSSGAWLISASGGGGTVGPGTTNEIAYFDSATTVASLTTATYPSLTELSYVKGVTSAIQTQINAKVPYTGATADLNLGTWDILTDTAKASTSAGLAIQSNAGTVTALFGAGGGANSTFYGGSKFDYATATTVPYFDASKNLVSSAVTPTELGYLSGVTSAIQTQLNAKQASDTQLTSLAALSYTGNAGKFIRVNAGETDFELATISGSGTVTDVSFTGGLISVATSTTTPALTVAGTSGGIPYFSSASTWASSAALTANAIVAGGGAGVAPYTMAGTSWDDTNRALTITGATVTASKPILDLSQTWNNAAVAFTGLKLNVTSTASAAASLLADLQVGGSTQFKIDKTGITTFPQWEPINGLTGYGMMYGSLTNSTNGIIPSGSGTKYWGFGITNSNTAIAISSGGSISFTDLSSLSIASVPDTSLYRDAAGALAQRRTSASQSFRVYKTYTDASNYERLSLNGTATSNWLQLAAETAGTGGDNLNLALTPSGTGANTAQVADSGTGGGNARGTYATDWQKTRGDAAHVASGNTSTLSGGRNNTSSGVDGWIPGGNYGTTRGLIGAYAYANGRFAADGDAQIIGQIVRKATTNATPAVLTADAGAASATNIMVLPNNSVYGFTAKVWAISGSNAGYWEVCGTMYRGANAAATALIGTTTITAFGVSAALSTAVVDVIADTTNGGAVIQVTGIAATNINWGGELSGGQGI